MSEIRKIEQYFSRSAAIFDSLYSQRDAPRVVRLINQRFRRDIYERFVLSMNHVRNNGLQSVLDVGCGSGRYAYELAQLGVRRIVGIDVSPGMVELATNRMSGLQSSNSSIEIVRGDFMEFHWDEKFDVVLAMGFFDYIKDALPVLSRMRDLANYSVIASFPSISWYRTPIRKFRYVFKRCPVYFYKRKNLEHLARAAGFVDSNIQKIEGAGQDYFAKFKVG